MRDAGLLSDALALASWSPLLATTLAQNPDYLHWLARERTHTRVKTREELAESLARFSLTQAMSSMMGLGLPLEAVVPMVTCNPAEMLGFADRMGALTVGFEADVTVLHDDRGRFLLRDNENTKVVADRLLRPAFCLRAGKRFDADSPILPQAVAA